MTQEPVEPTEISPEYAAHLRTRAVAEYMGTSPELTVGAIPEENLLRWQEALETTTNDPSELLAAGWIHAELALHYTVNPDTEEKKLSQERVMAIFALFEKAYELLRRVETHDSMQVDDLMRSQAGMAAMSMRVWTELIVGYKIAPRKNGSAYLVKQTDAAALLMRYAKQNQSVEASMWADTLTFIAIISMESNNDIPLPCPPRLSSPYVDSHHRQSAFLASRQNFQHVRVGSPGPAQSIHVPYELLGNEEYPGHAYGSLLSVIHAEEAWQQTTGPQRNRQGLNLSKVRKASEHLQKVGAQLMAHIEAERQKPDSAPEEVPDDSRDWVRGLQPGRNPYVVDAERTDAAISPLELLVADETITADEALELGWLYAEVAFGRAIDPTVPAVRVQGDIDRAEEIFAIALEKADEQDVLQFCEISLAQGAAWMQRVVLCNESLREEDISYYRHLLLYVGRRATTRHAELPPDSPEAAQLAELIHRTTLCALVMNEGEGLVAVITPPRQRSLSGWDVTVWSWTTQGFRPGEYGRLRITDREDPSSFADGIVTVTPQHLGQLVKQGKQKTVPFKTINAMADVHDNVPLPSGAKPHERQVIITKAWKVVQSRIAATGVM